jgi:hypothetical protein
MHVMNMQNNPTDADADSGHKLSSTSMQKIEATQLYAPCMPHPVCNIKVQVISLIRIRLPSRVAARPAGMLMLHPTCTASTASVLTSPPAALPQTHVPPLVAF